MKQSKGDDALIAEIQAAYEKVGEKAKDINTAIGTTAEDGKVRVLEEQFEHDARFSSLVVRRKNVSFRSSFIMFIEFEGSWSAPSQARPAYQILFKTVAKFGKSKNLRVLSLQ